MRYFPLLLARCAFTLTLLSGAVNSEVNINEDRLRQQGTRATSPPMPPLFRVDPLLQLSSLERSQAKAMRLRWLRLKRRLLAQPRQRQLAAVNDFYNQFAFRRDPKLWGEKDYWPTPAELTGRGMGDCEDFALAKYLALRELGIADHQLRLVYGRLAGTKGYHMLLAVYLPGRSVPLVLDNLIASISPLAQRSDFLPIYGFNRSFIWLMGRFYKAAPVNSARNMSRWQDYLARHQQQM